MAFNSGLGMAQSYYAATANAFASAPKLEGDHSADVVRDRRRLHRPVRSAASGRTRLYRHPAGSGPHRLGRIGPQWRADDPRSGAKAQADLVKTLRRRRKARTLFDLALEARTLTVERIHKHNIACDLVLNGHLLAGAKAGRCSVDGRRGRRRFTAIMDYPHASVLTPAETRERLNAPNYHHGLLDAWVGIYTR